MTIVMTCLCLLYRRSLTALLTHLSTVDVEHIHVVDLYSIHLSRPIGLLYNVEYFNILLVWHCHTVTAPFVPRDLDF